MADFSDDQDMQLVHLVLPFLQQGCSIPWDSVVKRLRTRGKSKTALRERLKTLKKTHGKTLDRFTSSFFRTRLILPSVQRPAQQPAQYKGVELAAKSHDVHSTEQHNLQQNIALKAALHIADIVLQGITQQDIRQQSGKGHLNAGEVAPEGVSKLVKALNVGRGDIFGDIGCRIGNILVEVAVNTNAQACVGIEVRPEVVPAAHNAIEQYATQYPKLLTVSIFSR